MTQCVLTIRKAIVTEQTKQHGGMNAPVFTEDCLFPLSSPEAFKTKDTMYDVLGKTQDTSLSVLIFEQ